MSQERTFPQILNPLGRNFDDAGRLQNVTKEPLPVACVCWSIENVGGQAMPFLHFMPIAPVTIDNEILARTYAQLYRNSFNAEP